MTPARALRLAAILYIILVVVATMTAGEDDAMAPEPLRTWRAENPFPPVYQIGGTAALFATFIGAAGLIRQHRWAAHLHLAAISVWIALSLTLGYGVTSGPSAMLVSAMLIVSGFIYGLAFFTDALDPVEPDHASDAS